MAFESMLGARAVFKKVSIEKKIWDLMEMALDPRILPWHFGKGSHRSSTNGFAWETITSA